MENMDPGDENQLQVEFFTKDEQKGTALPKFPFSIPNKAAKDELNALLNSYLKQDNDDFAATTFSFLIDGVLLQSSLKEFLKENEAGKESVLKIECVESEPAPVPELDLPHDDWVGAVFATPQLIVSGTYNNSVCVWNRKASKPKSITATVHQGPVKCLALIGGNADAITFVSGSQDQDLILWEFQIASGSLSEKYCLKGHERSVEAVCCNADGTRIASGGFDSFLKIWNPDAAPVELGEDSVETTDAHEKKRKTGKSPYLTPMVTLAGHKEAITGVSWTKDPKEVATASWDHSILLWDLELAGQKNSMSGGKAFTSLSCSPSSEMILTGSVDKYIRLWDPRSREGSMVKQTFSSHDGWVTDVNWHRNRENLFVSSSYDSLLKMWDTRSPAAPLYDLSGHEDRVLACDWTDPTTIVSGGVDNSVKTFRSRP